jgi:hypothetical protein
MGKKKKQNINDLIFTNKQPQYSEGHQCCMCTQMSVTICTCGEFCRYHYENHKIKCDFQGRTKRYKCPICGKEDELLQKHIKEQHPNTKITQNLLFDDCVLNQCPNDMFKCEGCNKNMCIVHKTLHLRFTDHYVVKYYLK